MHFFRAVSPPCPHLALSWILSEVENLASFVLIIINLAQLVCPSVALPAELVSLLICKHFKHLSGLIGIDYDKENIVDCLVI